MSAKYPAMAPDVITLRCASNALRRLLAYGHFEIQIGAPSPGGGVQGPEGEVQWRAVRKRF